MEAVRGLELVPLPGQDECCGFGGTFAVKNAEVSTAMGLDKIRAIEESGATVCTAGDNSCLMQIGGCWPARARCPVPAPCGDSGVAGPDGSSHEPAR